MCNLLEHSENYAKTSAILWQYYRDEQSDNMKNLNLNLNQLCYVILIMLALQT